MLTLPLTIYSNYPSRFSCSASNLSNHLAEARGAALNFYLFWNHIQDEMYFKNLEFEMWKPLTCH